MSGIKDDFRSTVPTGYNVFSETFLDLLLFVTSSKTEITDLKLTTFVKQDVTRLQVSMDNVGRVQVVASAQKLVHEVLHVLVGELLSRVDDSVHVSLHQLSDDVNIFIASLCWGFEDVN